MRANPTHDIRMVKALKHLHLAPYARLISFNFLFRDQLQRDILDDPSRLGASAAL